MHRCWLESGESLNIGDTRTLSPEESAHVARVLRMKPGARVQLIAAERLYEAELIDDNERGAIVRVLSALPSPESGTRITLVQGLPKADKLEWMIQKATELGCWELWPVEMERSVARIGKADERKRERYARIALEAAKQSGRAHVPQVRPASTLTDALPKLAGFDAVLVAWEEADGLLLSEAVRRVESPRDLALVIGPEGGIAPGEIERLRAVGAACVTLGPRILRTETAGLCGLSVILSALGEM